MSGSLAALLFGAVEQMAASPVVQAINESLQDLEQAMMRGARGRERSGASLEQIEDGLSGFQTDTERERERERQKLVESGWEVNCA